MPTQRRPVPGRAAAGAGEAATGAAGAAAGDGAAGAEAGPAGAGAAAGGASPGAVRRAIGWFTFTPAVPAGTRVRPRIPSSTASTSIVALSVSISAMMSPGLMASPSFFSQRARVPSVIVGERAGIRISIAMGAPFSGGR